MDKHIDFTNNKYYRIGMKKIIILILVIIGLLLIGGKAMAMGLYKAMDNSDFVILENAFTESQNVKVARFIDGKNTCYVSSSKGNSDTLTYNSISCVSNQAVNVTVQNTVPKK